MSTPSNVSEPQDALRSTTNPTTDIPQPDTRAGSDTASSPARGYDLVLVVEYFRTLTYYMSIIKYLSGQYRIGLFQVTIDPQLLSKQPAAQEQFVRLCVESGRIIWD